MLLILLASCASAPPLEQSHSDEQLAFMVKQAIRSEPQLFGTKILVTVTNGTVALGGYAPTDRQRQLAADVARGIEGVRSVINNIHL